MLLRRADAADISDVSITLDSLLSPANGKMSSTSLCIFSDPFRQRLTEDSDCDTAAVSNATPPHKATAINGESETDVPQKVPTNKKPRNLRLNHAGMENHLDLMTSRGAKHAQGCTHSSSSSSASGGLPQPPVNPVLKEDKADLSTEQVRQELGVKRYGLRKRKPCGGVETTSSNGEGSSICRMGVGGETSTSHNKFTSQTPIPTQAHCLVLKRPICCICGLSFSGPEECTNHLRRDHVVTDPTGAAKPHIACNRCPAQFAIPPSRLGSGLQVWKQVARWLNHTVRVHGSPIPPDVETFACEEARCGFVALTRASYETHQRKACHRSGTGSGVSSPLFFELRCFLCEGMRETFPSTAALRDHVTSRHVQTDNLRRILPCPVCQQQRPVDNPSSDFSGKSFGRRFFHILGRLLHHLVGKHGWSIPDYIRSFPCQFPGCRYTAVAQTDLDSHLVSHDSGTSNPSLPCEKCGKLVKSRTLRSHVRICQVGHRSTTIHFYSGDGWVLQITKKNAT